MKLYKIVVAACALGAVVSAASPMAMFAPAGARSREQRPVRRDLLVAAAASLSGVAQPLTQAFHDATSIDVRFNFAGSNTLARQIVEGARVDAFISADEAQMDVADRAGRVVNGTRVAVVGNQLVVIRAARGERDPGFRVDDLATAHVQRVAMGDPAAVPAGVYARQWLESVRLWSAIAPKVVPLPSSPAVVAAVGEGRAEIGIVYRSDVTQRQGVAVAYLVAPEDAPPITYPAAAIAGGRMPLAQQFIAFLRSPRAQEIFAAAGFRPLDAR